MLMLVKMLFGYSTNGTTWTILNTYYTTSYSNFTYIAETLPSSINSSSTQLRWRQLSNSGSGFDNWSIDDVLISGYNLGNYSFQWNDLQQSTTASISGLNAGVYQVTVTDSLGCAGVDSAIVNPFTPINVTVNTQDITCEGLTDGTATAVVTGGDAPYTYQFSGGIFFRFCNHITFNRGLLRKYYRSR